MSKPRILLVILVFVALAALELVTGFSRLSALRAGRTRELRDAVSRGHDELARRLDELLGAYERQARFLAQLDEVAALLRPAAPGEPRPGVPRVLTTCLDSFADIEQLLVLDGQGVTVLRLGRDAQGRPDSLDLHDAAPAADDDGRPPRSAGAVPLSPPPPDAARLARALRDGVLLDDLEPDRPAPGPLMVAPIGSPRGWLVLSLSALPLQAALAGFHPFERQRTRLVALDGGAAAATRSHAERPSDGSADDAGDRDLFVATTPTDSRPAFRLETTLPAAAVAQAMERIGREYSFVVGSMIAVTLALGIVGALVLRLGLRALRLNETEHYLRWIRRVTDRYRALLEGAADMILILEPGGALREANAAARQTLGLAPGDDEHVDDDGARTATLLARLPGDGAERFSAAVAAAGADPARGVSLPALSVTAADGDVLVVDAHVAGVDVGGEQVVQVSLRDVTRQRAVERRLQTAERLGSLGLLTAGVAHEINNPLEGMGNYLSLLERGGLPAEREQRYLGEVRRGLHRIRDLVQDLLAFARPSLDSSRADLGEVAREALGMVRYASGFEQLTVELRGLEQSLPVAGDPGRLGQVVLNLLLNASQALAGSGTITLSASRQRDDDGRSLLVLDVEDDGPGLPPEALGSLFDPFYSGSGGTGLGLAVSFGIIEAHGGTLTATNRATGGACLRLALPALLDDEPHENPAP